MSAIWHGLLFGYFGFFAGLGLMDFTWKAAGNTQIMADFAQTSFGKTFGKAISFVLTHLVISYHGMVFVYQDMAPGLALWANFYYIGHWGCILVIIVSNLLP